MSYIDSLLEQTGAGAAAEGIGGAIGSLFNIIGQNQQYKQAQRLQGLQIQGQQQMMDYGYQKQMDMWNATNYPAQMQQLEKAGLNPSLMYAKGGPGGVTGTPAANVQGQQAQGGQQMMGQAMGIMSQNALIESQRKNIDADTALKTSQIPVQGATVPKLNAETQSILQGIKNQKAQEFLTNAQSWSQQFDNMIKGKTQDDILRTITAQMDNWEEQAKQMNLKTTQEQATLYTKIDTIKQQLIGTILDNELTKATIGKTTQEIQVMKNDIQQKWTDLAQRNRGLDQKDIELNIQNFEAEMKSAYPSIWGIMGNTLQTLGRLADSRRPTYEIPNNIKTKNH